MSVKAYSARRRRRFRELRIDGAQAVRPGELGEVHRVLGEALAPRPFRQAAEVVVVHLVERYRPDVGVPLVARRLLAQAVDLRRVGRHGLEIALRLVPAFHDRAQEALHLVGAVGGAQEFRPRTRDQVALDVAGGIRELVRVVGADLERARADRLPDEEGGDVAFAQRRRQELRVEVLHRHALRIDAVLGQVLGDEPRAGRADARGDGLAGEVFRRADVLARDHDVALGVALYGDKRLVLAGIVEEVLHARQVAGPDDVA